MKIFCEKDEAKMLGVIRIRATGLEHPRNASRFAGGESCAEEKGDFIVQRQLAQVLHYPVSISKKTSGWINLYARFLVRATGLEPALTRNRILNPARLPIPPCPRTVVLYHIIGGLSREFTKPKAAKK